MAFRSCQSLFAIEAKTGSSGQPLKRKVGESPPYDFCHDPSEAPVWAANPCKYTDGTRSGTHILSVYLGDIWGDIMCCSWSTEGGNAAARSDSSSLVQGAYPQGPRTGHALHLDDICGLACTLRRRKLDTREKTGKHTPFHRAPMLWRKGRRAWRWHTMLGNRYPHGKESGDSNYNALPPRRQTFPELVRAHFAKVSAGTHGFLLLVLPFPSLSGPQSILLTPRSISTRALPRRDWGVGEGDLVHEPIFGIIFK
jgi:hypothetical protein